MAKSPAARATGLTAGARFIDCSTAESRTRLTVLRVSARRILFVARRSTDKWKKCSHRAVALGMRYRDPRAMMRPLAFSDVK